MQNIIRNLFSDLKNHLSYPEISVFVGPRQAGKTTLLLCLKDELDKAGKKTVFLNLDVDRDSVHFGSQEALIAKIRLELGDSPGVVFMDEIQRRPDAGLFLKGLYDLHLPYKFVVSGSGSLELKAGLNESLAGRKRVFELMPVSLSEFIRYRTGYRYEERLDEFLAVERDSAMRFLEEYLRWGGYPRIVCEPVEIEKRRIMDELFSSYVERDIVALLGVERPDAFVRLVRTLASRTGRIVNHSELASVTGLSVPTLKTYLWVAEKTFVIRTLTPYFTNRGKEIAKSPSVYFVDPGMRNHALGVLGAPLPSAETGFLFQNWIYTRLREILQWTGYTLHFWRTTAKAEVDFVVNKHHGVLPVEVKYAFLKKPEVTRSLRSFVEKYRPEEAWVVNLSLEQDIHIADTRILFIPWFRLLSNDPEGMVKKISILLPDKGKNKGLAP